MRVEVLFSKQRKNKARKTPAVYLMRGSLIYITMIVELSERAAYNNCIYMPNDKILIFS